MQRLQNVFLLLALAAAVACGGSYDRRLVEIDSLTLSEPRQAMALLDSLPVESFSTADRMYFELLRIKARDKAFIDHKSDSAVAEIVEFFESHDTEKLPEAYYYAGSVYRDLHDAPQAVAYFQKCIDALPGEGYLRMKSNAYFQCGELFRMSLLKEQSVEMFEEALRYDSIGKDTIRMIESLTRIALSNAIILEHKKFDSVVFTRLQRALELAKAINDDYQIMTVTNDFAYVYSYLNDYDKVGEYLPYLDEYFKKYDGKHERNNYNYIRARRLIALKCYDEALPICEELKDCGFADYSRYASQYLYKIYASKGQFAETDSFLDRYEFLTDTIMVSKASDATAQANALYNYQLRERDNLTLKAESRQRLYLVFILAAAALLIGGGFWVYRLRQKQKQQILNQQISRLRQFERLLKEQSEATATKQDLTRQRLFESEAYEILQQRIAKNRPLRDADLAILDETVNQICDGFKSTLYSAYNLSAQEYAICLLVKFDVPGKDISCLLNRTKSAISHTRKRLFEKLFGREGSANELDAYIASL